MLPFVVQFKSGKPVYEQVLLAVKRALGPVNSSREIVFPQSAFLARNFASIPTLRTKLSAP